jgi:type I restriction enzyme, S subunit
MSKDIKYDLPKGWRWTKLEEVCSIVTDGTHKTPVYTEVGIPFISIANIQPFSAISFDKYCKYIADSEHKELSKRSKVEKDDILFPRIGTLGYAKRVDWDYEVSIFVGLGLAKPKKDIINPKYLEYYMNTKWVNNYSRDFANGSGRLTLPLSASRTMPVPLPSQAVQQSIVSKIEELFSELDKGIEQLKTAHQQLKIYRQAVLKWAFEGKLTSKVAKDGQLPKDWTITQLDKISFFLNGDRGKNYPNKNEYVRTGIPFINTGHIESNGSLDLATMNYISREKFDSLNGGKIKKGDLVYCLRGATIGKIAFVDQFSEGAIASSLVIIRPDKNKTLTKYLFYYLKSPLGRECIKQFDNGTAQPNLSAKSLSLYTIPIPETLESQNTVVKEIESRLSIIDELELVIIRALQRSESLRKSILKRAFEGKLAC